MSFLNFQCIVESGVVISGTCLGLYYLDKQIVRPFLKEKIDKLKKDLKLDTVGNNKFIVFGVTPGTCPFRARPKECFNLDCNDGRINHILRLIDNAENTLEVCIYILTAHMIGNAIARAYKRGVKVRMIVDHDMACSSQSVIHDLRKKKIPIRQKASPFIMHHKFIIIDDKTLINGSLNFTMTGIYCNWESVLITTQPTVVEAFQNIFSTLWDDFQSVPQPHPITGTQQVPARP